MRTDAFNWDLLADPKWLLDKLLNKYKIVRVATNYGWNTDHSGSGGGTQEPFRKYVWTGTTASSRGMYLIYVFVLNSGYINRIYIDWTKRLEWRFWLCRDASDPEAVARIQLKESNAEGALAERGIGIEIQNLTMYGEGYGTVRGTVQLGTLTSHQIARVRIVKEGSRLEFWVNGILKGVLTGNYVPNEKGTTAVYEVFSIVNGPTGGVNAILMNGDETIIQEW